MSNAAVALTDVVFRYYEHGKRNILDHVNLTIDAGKTTVLMAAGGSGKSTLAAVAAGLYPENGGYLEGGRRELFGMDVGGMTHAQRAKLLSLMFQNPDLQFCMDTLRSEMVFCMENMCVPPEEMDGRIEDMARRMGLTEKLDRKLVTLSGGEKQRATLACLLLLKSRALLLDEAFANLDADATHAIMEVLKEEKARGTTIIAIDHRLDAWMDVADEVILLGEGGNVVRRGLTPSTVCEARADFEREGVFLPEDGAAQMQTPKPHGEDAITLRGVTIREGAPLVENASIGFEKGSLTALLGASGSGKTTTLRTLLGRHAFDGEILINGSPLNRRRAKTLFREVGIVFQNPGNQFISQNVLAEVCSALKGSVPAAEMEARAREELRHYGLERYTKVSPYMLSQGQQRRLAVLCVLCGGQKLLLLDEPTYGQDDRATAAIMETVRRRMAQDGLTVLMVTHDTAMARKYADRIVRLTDKHFVEEAASDA